MKMTRQSELFVKALADGMGQVKGLMRHISITHFLFSYIEYSDQLMCTLTNSLLDRPSLEIEAPSKFRKWNLLSFCMEY